ncbi:MAG: IS200/IS605 family transposase [Ignavibacteriaceae bacterium]|nr:IS200/IS605 family transposase [Ignavibacteriaceae bacterium]
MANTYTQLYIHIIFATKTRMGVISPQWKEDLYKYISGIIKNRKQKLYIINGMSDHIHILVSMSPDLSVSDLVRDVKAVSSKYINENKLVAGRFEWQRGFGAFSVSPSKLESVIDYIKDQEEHHRIKSFREEYEWLLKAHAVDYDPRYIIDSEE